jgi:hypothetical protein
MEGSTSSFHHYKLFEDTLGTLFPAVQCDYLSPASGFDLRRLLCANHAAQKTDKSIAHFYKNRKDYTLRKASRETTSPKGFPRVPLSSSRGNADS